MIAINFKTKINEKAQFTGVNEHFEAIFNEEIGSRVVLQSLLEYIANINIDLQKIDSSIHRTLH